MQLLRIVCFNYYKMKFLIFLPIFYITFTLHDISTYISIKKFCIQK